MKKLTLGALLVLCGAFAAAQGPPTSYPARTDTTTVQLPSPLPNVGNLVGANSVVVDPSFGSQIVRVTDAKTNPDHANFSFHATASGSGDQNIWNTNSTLFVISDQGSWMYPFSFSPSTLQASRLYVSSYPSTNGMLIGSASGSWSFVDPALLYVTRLEPGSSPIVSSYNFSSSTTPPSPSLVYNFSTSPNCLPGLSGTTTWMSGLSTNSDDTVFGLGFSNAGHQDTGIYAAAYTVGAGCSWYNTSTQTVGGDWGASGSTGLSDKFTIHNVRTSKDGNWLIITPACDTGKNCTAFIYYWQIGTLNVSRCTTAECGGHFTVGYTHGVNNSGPPPNQAAMGIRTFSNPSSFTELISSFPAVAPPWDAYPSWNNAVSADNTPVLTGTASSTTPFPAAWYNEILGIATDGSGTVWRFAHNFITGVSGFFDAKYAIGAGSQDGLFYLFTSDWQGALGSASGSSTCTIGTNCRADVFIVNLMTAQ